MTTGVTKYITLYSVERAFLASLSSHDTFLRRAAISGDAPHVHRHIWIPTEASKHPNASPTNSTFYADGYQDAKNGFPPSPPHHPDTTVFASEYMSGYHAFNQAE